MNPHGDAWDDETRISEIILMPNGQIYVFGMSRQVLELLDDLNLGDPAVGQRRQHLRTVEPGEPCEAAVGEHRLGGTSSAVARPSPSGESEP